MASLLFLVRLACTDSARRPTILSVCKRAHTEFLVGKINDLFLVQIKRGEGVRKQLRREEL